MSIQELRVQEPNNEVPPGNTPKTMKVICKDMMCRTSSPGDMVILDGV